LRHAKRVAAIFVGNAGSLCDQLQDGLTCLVELIACGRRGAFARSRERNDLWILSELTVHRTTLRAERLNLPPKIAAADDNTTRWPLSWKNWGQSGS
jgi:hypothetical protein